MYILITNLGRIIFRAKGLCLDEKVGKHLNFDVLTAMLLGRTDQAQQFYNAIEDTTLSARLKKEHEKRWGGDDKREADVEGLVLPDPQIVRNWKQWGEPIRNDSSRVKQLRFTFTKRRVCSRPECRGGAAFGENFRVVTHPWGYNHTRDSNFLALIKRCDAMQ